MKSVSTLRAKTFALAIAVGFGGPATTVRADELQELKAQIEALQKKVGEMEMKQDAQQAGSTAADAKGLPVAADDGSLTFHGITLYGAIDVGVTYQSHGT